jgi:hypothetical protein
MDTRWDKVWALLMQSTPSEVVSTGEINRALTKFGYRPSVSIRRQFIFDSQSKGCLTETDQKGFYRIHQRCRGRVSKASIPLGRYVEEDGQ